MQDITNPDSAAVLQQIADATDQSIDYVELVVQTLRETVEALFLDGYSILTDTFTLVAEGDPTVRLIEAKINTATQEQFDAFLCGEDGEIAEWLGIDIGTYLRHPVASEWVVIAHVADRLGLGDTNYLEHPIAAISYAWFGRTPGGRAFPLPRLGLEQALEDWLVADPSPLERAVGYRLQLRTRQLVLPDRRRPDLVFDMLGPEDDVVGTLVVELKVVGGYHGAVDQVCGYLDAFEDHDLARGDVLHGLLVADGFPPDVLAYADSQDINILTLAQLGYRRGLGFQTSNTQP